MVRLLKALPPLVNCCVDPEPSKTTVPPFGVNVPPTLLFQLPDTNRFPVGAFRLSPAAAKVTLATCKLAPLTVTAPLISILPRFVPGAVEMGPRLPTNHALVPVFTVPAVNVSPVKTAGLQARLTVPPGLLMVIVRN